MLNTFNNTIKIIIAIIVIGLLCVGCYFGYKTINNYKIQLANANNKINELTIQNGDLIKELAIAKDQYVTMQANTQTKTEVVYIEKESPNDADVEVKKVAPTVVVTAGDGKSYTYKPDSNSYQTLKDGKAIINEENTLTLDIEKIVDDRFKDKIEAMDAKCKLELKTKQDELDTINRKLKITKRQRDFYAGTAIVGTAGGFMFGYNKRM